MAKLIKNPYIGPRPFLRSPEDQTRFYGRRHETDRLITLIYCHQLTLLYSITGAGKTSLLNAQVIPTLEQDSFDVLPIARVHGSYVGRERDIGHSNSNFYLMNAMTSLKPAIDPSSIENMSFHDFWNAYFSKRDKRGKPCYQVIILDQLEEMFKTILENWLEQRENFFKEISETLDKNPFLRVVFVIREDYLAEMDPFVSLLPERLRARIRLERLTREDAILAVTEPFKNTGLSFENGVAEKLVDDLMTMRVESSPDRVSEISGNFVEPIYLQIVCQRLWEKSITAGINTITFSQLVDDDVDEALEEFYEEAIRAAIQRSRIVEGDLRKWCEETLITPRQTRSLVHRDQAFTMGMTNEVIDVLETKRLIRGEWRYGAKWYELTHDRLIKPILDSNRLFESKQKRSRSKRYFFGKS